MQFKPRAISDVVLIEPRVFTDERGYFMETWQLEKFAAAGIDVNFVQANQSVSKRHVLRGLHYQIEHPQGKLVRALSGEIFDVAVDIRRSSPTFGSFVTATLSDENRHSLWVPPGFAHGFLVLSERAEVSYYCTDYYAPQYERTLRWNDEKLGIPWPLPAGSRPVINQKDENAATFDAIEYFP